MAGKRWNSQTTLIFIQVFRSYEYLWKQRYVKHRHEAYQKLVDEMGLEGFGVVEAKKKMRTLRSTYYQEKRKIENARKLGILYTPNIPWYNEMDELLNDIGKEKRLHMISISKPEDSNFQDQDYHFDDYEEDEEDSLLTHDEMSFVIEEIKTESPPGSPPIRSDERKRKEISLDNNKMTKKKSRTDFSQQNEIDNKDDLLLATAEKDDQFDVFGKSVAMQLRGLSFERSMLAQMRIQNILTKLSIENYRSDFHKIESTETLYDNDDDDEEEGLTNGVM